MSARRVAIRSQQPWYWKAVVALFLVAVGYLIGYWQLGGMSAKASLFASENQQLQDRLIQVERQLQVEKATHGHLEKELVRLQDESLKLKEDILFYQNMLGEKDKGKK